MEQPAFFIRFWDHDPRVKDCFGNSLSHEVKGRNTKEVLRKFEKWHAKRQGVFPPRLHSIQKANTNPVPAMPQDGGSRGDRHKAMLKSYPKWI